MAAAITDVEAVDERFFGALGDAERAALLAALRTLAVAPTA